MGRSDPYIFRFYNIHPITDNVQFHFQCSTDGGSNYNVTQTTSFYSAWNGETAGYGLAYQPNFDLAQSTDYQQLAANASNADDESCAGELHLFNPSSTVYVKNWFAHVNEYANGDYNNNDFPAGYFNTTTAINAINFKMSSGNIDSGTIKMYGVK